MRSFSRWRWRGENAFAQFACETAPQIVEADVLVVEFVAGKFQEGDCAGGTKGNAKDASLLVGVDGKTLGMRTADATPLKVCIFRRSSGS